MKTAFSPDCKYFAAFSADDKLLIWETLDSVFIDCKYDSSVHGTCTSLHWVFIEQKYASPRKTRSSRNLSIGNSYLLAVGTVKGDIFLYNVVNKNLYSHFVGRHSDAVNDMCFRSESNSIFTCSNDRSIAAWDVNTGRKKMKWTADDNPVTSICVVDSNNLLSSSTSIIWWNILEQSIIKKFNGHSTEIFKLLPVNAVSLNSCYFLSAAVNDFKIKAWSLNSVDCQTPVASFVLPVQPHVVDISEVSSKDKPLILSTIAENGILHLFEHTLNGNLNQPIQPKVSLEQNIKSLEVSIVSTKLSSDLESCIVAYGTSKSDMTFKHIKIKESLNKNEAQSIASTQSPDKFSTVTETSETDKDLLINGIKPVSTLENSPRAARLRDVDAVVSNCRRNLRCSSKTESLTQLAILNTSETEDSESNHRKRNCLKEPKSSMDILLNGLETQNEDAINAILNNSDAEFINTSVKNLPRNRLKDVLTALNHRLHNHQKYSPALSKWLKEILRIHLHYLVQCKDTEDALSYMKKHVDSMKISETVSKLCVLKGFLNLQIQISSSEESDSESEELMEL